MNILCLWVNKTVLIPDTKSRKRSIEKKINYRSSCADMHTKDLNSRDYASNTSIPFDWSSFEKFSDISPSEIPSWITRDIITDIVIDRNNGGYGRENNRNRGWSATTRAPCVHLSRINAVYVRSQRKQPAYIVNHEFVVINYAFRPITSSPASIDFSLSLSPIGFSDLFHFEISEIRAREIGAYKRYERRWNCCFTSLIRIKSLKFDNGKSFHLSLLL